MCFEKFLVVEKNVNYFLRDRLVFFGLLVPLSVLFFNISETIWQEI